VLVTVGDHIVKLTVRGRAGTVVRSSTVPAAVPWRASPIRRPGAAGGSTDQ
jgi:hypothetical protein